MTPCYLQKQNCVDLRRFDHTVKSIGISVVGQTTVTSTSCLTPVDMAVYIEGNYGAGKRDLVDCMKQKYGDFLYATIEPISLRKLSNLVDLFAKDPKRWAFTCLIDDCQSRFVRDSMAEISAKPISLMTGSIHTTQHVLVPYHHDVGNISDIEKEVLSEEYSNLTILANLRRPKLIVYVRTAPEICFQRVQERNLWNETFITQKLLESTAELYDDWLLYKQKNYLHGVQVLMLDGGQKDGCVDILADHLFNMLKTYMSVDI